jgi:starch synthase
MSIRGLFCAVDGSLGFAVIAALKIVLVASETAPFAKTGGLADVVAALARTLHRQGHDVRVFLPLYGSLLDDGHDIIPVEGLRGIRLDYADRSVTCGVSTATLPNSERDDGTALDVEFIDCPELFHRDGYYTSDPDEHLRWATLCRGMLEALRLSDWAPDVVHCNDWHTGLVPLYLRTTYSGVENFAGTRTLLSIHNMSFQGTFDADVVRDLGLSEVQDMFHQDHLAQGRVSYLETGILYASWLGTVSETYAVEIQGEELGMGLDPLLRARSDQLVGIVNGVDVDEWSPDRDTLIPHPFSAADLAGKTRCREALLDRFGIAHDPDAMVVGIISRLTAQKGFELLPDVLPELLEQGRIRLVVLGSGEERYERYFQSLHDAHPAAVGVYLGFHDELAHWIEAGADLFLMPSRFEPCGLNQMFSLRYGTVPLVRHTGGLADTVQPWDMDAGTGTGFVFHDFTLEALAGALDQALEAWEDRSSWATLMQNGMAMDYSWERQSEQYLDLYQRMVGT